MVSLSRMLAALALLVFAYTGAVGVTVVVMKRQLELRLLERAEDDVRLALADRLLGARETVEQLECRGGLIDTGVGAPPAGAAWPATDERGALRVVDGTILGVRADGAGRLAWARLRPTTPAALLPWRLVGIVFAAGLLGLLVLVGAVAWVSRRDTAAAAGFLEALRTSPDGRIDAPRLLTREYRELVVHLQTAARALVSASERRLKLERQVHETARLAQLGTLVMGMAHEVRNPLAAMKLRVDLLRQDAGREQVRDLELILRDIARLDRLVDELLLLGGKSPGPPREEALYELVTERLAQLSPVAKAAGVELVLEGERGPRVPLHADALARALDNLLLNAISFSPPGARVVVRVVARAGHFSLTVEDSGPGVLAGKETSLFTPFFTTRRDGVGLGLSIVRSIAALHGGEARYERVDAKTRFTLTGVPVTMHDERHAS